jgi:hypothetical protein
MTLIDQASGKATEAAPTVAIYRKSERGIVCKVIEQTDAEIPAGWVDSPYTVGWDGESAILVANVHDEIDPDTAPQSPVDPVDPVDPEAPEAPATKKGKGK